MPAGGNTRFVRRYEHARELGPDGNTLAISMTVTLSMEAWPNLATVDTDPVPVPVAVHIVAEQHQSDSPPVSADVTLDVTAYAQRTEEAPQTLVRITSGIAEFDRVCGGGLVPGSAILIGGDPGIGKSTLMLQVAARLAGTRLVIYISGEEAVDQIRLRASRLAVAKAPVQLAAATDIRNILASIETATTTAVVMVDSIQTMHVDALDSAPGTVAQVRASAQALIRLAKRRGFVVLLVGHVTKLIRLFELDIRITHPLMHIKLRARRAVRK